MVQSTSQLNTLPEAAITKRHNQGWVMQVTKTVQDCIAMMKRARVERQPLSIAYHVGSSEHLSSN